MAQGLPFRITYTFMPFIFSIDDVGKTMMSNYKVVVHISQHGQVSWSQNLLMTTTCPMDFRRFPYDELVCPLRFISWNYDNSSIFLRSKPISLSNDSNHSWNITKVNTNLVYVDYYTHKYPFSFNIFDLHMRRNYTPLTIGLVIPSALLSALVLLSFMLPVECGERISLCMTILLTVMLFQQLTSEMIPRSQLPYISQYFFIILIIQVLILVANVLVIHLYFNKDQKQIPLIAQKIFLHDPYYKRLAKSNVVNDPPYLEDNNTTASSHVGSLSNTELRQIPDGGIGSTNHTRIDDDAKKEPRRFVTLASDWTKICNLLDRVFLILFGIAFISAFVWVSVI